MKISKDITTLILKPEEVHVWLVNLENLPDNYPSWERLLAEDEIGRARCYKFDRDRLRFIARRGILRQLISRYTGMQPAEITYSTNPNGKLSLPSHSLKFNGSHSQNWIVYAFAVGYEIGIDIEQVCPLPELARLAESAFSPEECSILASVASTDQLSAFYHLWTQKEAVIKAQGAGLSNATREFTVSLDSVEPGKFYPVKGNGFTNWQVACFLLEVDLYLSVSIPSKGPQKIILNQPENSVFFGDFPAG